MPTRAVEHHHHDMLVRVALPDLVEEQLHAVGIDVGQDQRVEFAAEHIDRSISIGRLVSEHGLAQRAYGSGCPAAAHVVDAAESRLVLEHQPERGLVWPERAHLGKPLGEFFFHSC
jgi:hypothetical protein